MTYDAIFSHLPATRPLHLLDIGCSTCTEGQQLLDRGITLTGILMGICTGPFIAPFLASFIAFLPHATTIAMLVNRAWSPNIPVVIAPLATT